jgi:hypothetical protein
MNYGTDQPTESPRGSKVRKALITTLSLLNFYLDFEKEFRV